MGIETKTNDVALRLLKESLSSADSNEIAIGEHEREIERLRRKKCEDEKKARILAVNFFTETKIQEIHKNAEELRLSTFDEEEFIKLFSNNSTVTIEKINYLLELLDDIETASQINTQKKGKEPVGFWVKLAEAFLEGGARND